MKYISPDTLQNFCRTCLKQLKQRQRFNIQTLDIQIQRWLEDINGDDPLEAGDSYPNSICYSCTNKLKNFFDFHLMCKESRKTILKILTNRNDKIKRENVSHQIEPLIECYCIIDNEFDKRTDNPDKDTPCTCDKIDNDECTNVSQEKSVETLENILNERQIKRTESESENPIGHIDCKNSVEENIFKINPKSGNVGSKVKDKRKKYTYTFRCDQCKYRCISQQILDIHMRIHCGLRPYKCSKCEESFDKSSQMLKHLHDTHGEKELIIICEYEKCGQRFNSNRSYKGHYRQSHISQQQIPIKEHKIASKSLSKHVCEECGKIYTKLQTFKEHQYTHGPKEHYPYQCKQCDKSFVKQRTFNEHKLRHAGIKKFECTECGARKTTKKELRSHMNCHTRERKYPCPNCPMVFYRSSNRRIHVDVVHQGIRRFVCRYCEQTFGKGDNLKNHELIHTGEKPHACLDCGKRFVQRVSLRSHMKTHNK